METAETVRSKKHPTVCQHIAKRSVEVDDTIEAPSQVNGKLGKQKRPSGQIMLFQKEFRSDRQESLPGAGARLFERFRL